MPAVFLEARARSRPAFFAMALYSAEFSDPETAGALFRARKTALPPGHGATPLGYGSDRELQRRKKRRTPGIAAKR
jgi:hypothetical protein